MEVLALHQATVYLVSVHCVFNKLCSWLPYLFPWEISLILLITLTDCSTWFIYFYFLKLLLDWSFCLVSRMFIHEICSSSLYHCMYRNTDKITSWILFSCKYLLVWCSLSFFLTLSADSLLCLFCHKLGRLIYSYLALMFIGLDIHRDNALLTLPIMSSLPCWDPDIVGLFPIWWVWLVLDIVFIPQ